MTTPENQTPDPSAPRQPGRAPESRDEEETPAEVDPREALEGLEGRPRIDEQGHPTAYTAVPPPLGEQRQTPPEGPEGQRPPAAREQQQQQPPQYGQQQPSQPPYGQQPQYCGQPQWSQQPPPDQGPYAGASAQQPYGGPGGQGRQPEGAGQPQGGPGPQDRPPPGYGYPPPPPGYETYGAAPYGGGHVPGMPPYANWGQRAGAWLIDNIVAVVGLSMLEPSYYDWSYGIRALSWVIAAVGVVWAIYNAYLAGQTGQSTGKRLVGIRLGRYVDGQNVGPAFGLLRLFMNVVFWVICFIPGVLNYLWPLWDQKSQTWSDKIASSVVVRAR